MLKEAVNSVVSAPRETRVWRPASTINWIVDTIFIEVCGDFGVYFSKSIKVYYIDHEDVDIGDCIRDMADSIKESATKSEEGFPSELEVILNTLASESRETWNYVYENLVMDAQDIIASNFIDIADGFYAPDMGKKINSRIRALAMGICGGRV